MACCLGSGCFVHIVHKSAPLSGAGGRRRLRPCSREYSCRLRPFLAPGAAADLRPCSCTCCMSYVFSVFCIPRPGTFACPVSGARLLAELFGCETVGGIPRAWSRRLLSMTSDQRTASLAPRARARSNGVFAATCAHCRLVWSISKEKEERAYCGLTKSGPTAG